MIRRLRGLLSITLTICVPWTALGALAGLAVQVGAVPGLHLSGLVGAGALAGALVGVIVVYPTDVNGIASLYRRTVNRTNAEAPRICGVAPAAPAFMLGV